MSSQRTVGQTSRKLDSSRDHTAEALRRKTTEMKKLGDSLQKVCTAFFSILFFSLFLEARKRTLPQNRQKKTPNQK